MSGDGERCRYVMRGTVAFLRDEARAGNTRPRTAMKQAAERQAAADREMS